MSVPVYCKKHYGHVSLVITSIVLATLITGCIIDARVILIAIFIGPFLMVYLLWITKDKTLVEFIDNQLIIKEVHQAFSSNYKINVADIVTFKIINQGFTKAAHRAPPTRVYFGMIQTLAIGRNKSHTKKMIAIQTSKKVIRIGQYMDDEELNSLLEYLKVNLKRS